MQAISRKKKYAKYNPLGNSNTFRQEITQLEQRHAILSRTEQTLHPHVASESQSHQESRQLPHGTAAVGGNHQIQSSNAISQEAKPPIFSHK
jgi:hypothetical protein